MTVKLKEIKRGGLLHDLDSEQAETIIDNIDSTKIFSEQEPVLKVRVNYFVNGGMCLGIAWYHSLGDMATFMGFMKAWSNQVAGLKYSPPLIVEDRCEYLSHHLQDNGVTTPGFRYLEPEDVETMNHYMETEASDHKKLQFYFSEQELQQMKQSYREKSDEALSVNDVLCTHIFSAVMKHDPVHINRYLTVTVNYRPRTGLPGSLAGNLLSTINLFCNYGEQPEVVAGGLRQMINHYAEKHLDHYATERFVEEKGGSSEISKFAMLALDPVHRTLNITNWSNFGVYKINFGGENPFYFTQHGPVPFPWLSAVSEGFDNQGLIFTIFLPTQIAKDILDETSLKALHQYRAPQSHLPEIVQHLKWIY